MVEEVINNIIEAEQKADNIIKESQVRSKEIVAKAKEDAINIVEEGKKSVQLSIAQKNNAAFAKASTDAKQAIDDCELQAQELEKVAQKNEKKAIDYIIGRMISKYDK